MKKLRLDEWLVARGHYPSRARARDAIKRGCISMGGDLQPKPSRTVPNDNAVQIDDPALKYVSRAALKLVHALEETKFAVSGKTALDLGSSTGGFCQVLLDAGAKHVFGVDVGHGQLAEQLINRKRLTNLENLNARDLKLEHIGSERPNFITSDVSFISLKLALPRALEMAAEGANGIFLVKPQFEVGKDGLGRGGIIREPGLALEVAKEIRMWLENFSGWRVTHFMPSPITGGDGNQEYLLAGTKDD